MNILENIEGNILEEIDDFNIQIIHSKSEAKIDNKDIWNVLIIISDVHFKNCNLYIDQSEELRDKYRSYINSQIVSEISEYNELGILSIKVMYVFCGCVFEDSYIENKLTSKPYISGLTVGSMKLFTIDFPISDDIMKEIYTKKCTIKGSIFYGLNAQISYDPNNKIINKNYTGMYGYKLVLAKFDTDLNNIYVPVIIKLKILGTAIIPAIQSNKRHKIRTNNAIVESVYIINPKKSSNSNRFNRSFDSFKPYEIIRYDIVREAIDKINICVYDNLLSPFYNTQEQLDLAKDIEYVLGNTVYEPEFSNSPIECDKGIHFFETMEDALEIYKAYIQYYHWSTRIKIEILRNGNEKDIIYSSTYIV